MEDEMSDDIIHAAFLDAQARIDAGLGRPADQVVAALLGSHCSRVMTNAGIAMQSERDREVVRAIQKWAAETYLYACD
jgi:hypothetical protein